MAKVIEIRSAVELMINKHIKLQYVPDKVELVGRGSLRNDITNYIAREQIKLLKSVIEHPTKPGYKRHDVLAKITELEKELQ